MIARTASKCLSKEPHRLHGVCLGRKRFIFATTLPPAECSATQYDVVVVGGGHAGCEAAAASARMGSKTLMVTHKLSTIGEMSCNPSFGGIGKGHLMREIDALDGICARICDMSGIQFRVLNRSKGPAVWGLRAQIDRDKYRSNMQHEIFNTKGLTVLEESVEDLVIDSTNHFPHQKVTGVCLGSGRIIKCKAVVLTTGTFLRGRITIGLESFPAGRRGDPPSVGLANTLHEAGFSLGRLKTGTPPRIDGRTINFTFLQKQLGDDPPIPFSFVNLKNGIQVDQKPCYLTHTNAATHKIIVDNVHLNRHILEEVTGPRYCPSIESKVLRFKGKCHQVWLEPEGTHSNTVYPNGISCTLPADLQEKLVRSITGLESAELIFPGYGVEYDCIDARQLKSSLETRKIKGLHLAGQINGSTGYEEAASQGLVAGINAALLSCGKEAFTFSRTGSYIGVLIDDLTSVGASEPYRMFTSRSEHRIFLRPDNADIRLTSEGYKVGCVSWDRMAMTEDTRIKLENGHSLLSDATHTPQQWMKMFGIILTEDGSLQSAWSLLRSKKLTISDLVKKMPHLFSLSLENNYICQRLEIQAHYEELVRRQWSDVQRINREEQSVIPSGLCYERMTNISLECREALTRAQPFTIGEAKRVPGVTPAALLHIIHHIKNHK